MAVIYTKRMNRYLQEHSQPYDPAVFLCNRKVLLLHKKPSGQDAHSALRKYGC